jgi:hypothetical protein
LQFIEKIMDGHSKIRRGIKKKKKYMERAFWSHILYVPECQPTTGQSAAICHCRPNGPQSHYLNSKMLCWLMMQWAYGNESSDNSHNNTQTHNSQWPGMGPLYKLTLSSGPAAG